ncbi:MAG: hypothetical protein LBK69_05315, partial [Syntrophomonadaceae bacterium]|nr:hypothetical protein [Syntrophomonadaceae bacterium]
PVCNQQTALKLFTKKYNHRCLFTYTLFALSLLLINTRQQIISFSIRLQKGNIAAVFHQHITYKTKQRFAAETQLHNQNTDTFTTRIFSVQRQVIHSKQQVIPSQTKSARIFATF